MTSVSTSTPMPVVTVAGDATARGHQHGEALRSSIADCVAIYKSVFALADDDVVSRAAHFENVTAAWDEELAAEINAIAEAAGQPRHWLWALNARSEFMSVTGANETECTSVWSPGSQILAQNWDWIRSLEPLTVVLDATHEDDHHVVTVTEPGMVGKVGMSSAGTAVGLNFLFSTERLLGVPVHVLLRALLDARTPEEVEKRIATAGSNRSGHVFLACAGIGSSIEYTGSQMWRRDSADDPLLHTNHFINGTSTELPQGEALASSAARYERSVELVAEQGVADAEAIRSLLDDRGNTALPICRPWAPSVTVAGAETGTVCAILMRLADETMDVRLGPDPSGPWQSHRI